MRDGRHPVERSRECLRAARTGDAETTAACWGALASWDSADLAARLSDDATRTAFWLNVYNAAVQDDLRAEPARYDSRIRFFVSDRVTVAGHDLSLNDIEHGLLRGSRSVLGLGYLPRLLPSRFERTHRVDSLDPRIHFALNCGAASCPPIAAYSAERLDEELTLASESYLGSEVVYDLDSGRGRGVVRVPQLFLWYYGDFGGRAGTRDLLRRYGHLSADDSPKIRYRSYDWTLALDNFLDSDRDGSGAGDDDRESSPSGTDPDTATQSDSSDAPPSEPSSSSST
jgi:hypothetical protein